MSTITADTTELVVLRCWCGILHAVPETLRNTQLRAHENNEQRISIHCPLGHTHVPTRRRKCDDLWSQLQRERQRHDQTRASLRDTENQRRAEKAAKTRIKNRVGKGVCPCCNRSFQNLKRHMDNKHPDYAGAAK